MSAAAFAAEVAARHRVHRWPLARLALVFARPPARGVPGPAGRPGTPGGSLLHLLAPRISLTIAADQHEAPPPPSSTDAAPAARAPASPRIAEPRIAARQIERILDRVETLTVRREALAPPVPAPAVVAAPQRAAAVSPPPMTLARPAAASPAAPAHAAPTPASARATAPAAATPAPFEIERLADRVMASIDRRIVAERERRGRT